MAEDEGVWEFGDVVFKLERTHKQLEKLLPKEEHWDAPTTRRWLGKELCIMADEYIATDLDEALVSIVVTAFISIFE